MKIAMLGAGNVGGTLGRRWAELGHEITFAARDTASASVQRAVQETNGQAKAANAAEAVAEAEVVVLSTPWRATEAALQSAGVLDGKILIDCTNPVAPNLAGLEVGQTTSAAEMVASWAPGARVVKAFNCTGSGNMADPNYGDDKATMFICGDDADAKAIVRTLADTLGFEVCDAGPLMAARYLEPLAMLWIHLAYATGRGPNIAFKLLSR